MNNTMFAVSGYTHHRFEEVAELLSCLVGSQIWDYLEFDSKAPDSEVSAGTLLSGLVKFQELSRVRELALFNNVALITLFVTCHGDRGVRNSDREGGITVIPNDFDLAVDVSGLEHQDMVLLIHQEITTYLNQRGQLDLDLGPPKKEE
jgi:hypothetical protein